MATAYLTATHHENAPLSASVERAYASGQKQFQSRKISVLEWAAILYGLARLTRKYHSVLINLHNRLIDYVERQLTAGKVADSRQVVKEAETAALILFWIRRRSDVNAYASTTYSDAALKAVSYAMTHATEPCQKLRLVIADALHMSYFQQPWNHRGPKELHALLRLLLAQAEHVGDPRERLYVLRMAAFLLRREGSYREAVGCVLNALKLPGIAWSEREPALWSFFVMAR